MGDLNINLSNCESHPESNDFQLMPNSYFLLHYILQPTSITERSATIIDNIFANTYAAKATSNSLVLRISDHLPQFLIEGNVEVNYKTLNYYENDYSKFDEEKLRNGFSLRDWANILNNNLDANTKFDGFLNFIFYFFNFFIKSPSLLTVMHHAGSSQSMK